MNLKLLKMNDLMDRRMSGTNGESIVGKIEGWIYY
jgi:hypothetical protein